MGTMGAMMCMETGPGTPLRSTYSNRADKLIFRNEDVSLFWKVCSPTTVNSVDGRYANTCTTYCLGLLDLSLALGVFQAYAMITEQGDVFNLLLPYLNDVGNIPLLYWIIYFGVFQVVCMITHGIYAVWFWEPIPDRQPEDPDFLDPPDSSPGGLMDMV